MGDVEDGPIKAFFERRYADVHAIAERYLRWEQPNHTLRPTELVHLAFERLRCQRNLQSAGDDYILGAAAVTIRRELIGHARKADRIIHGGGREFVPIETATILTLPPKIDRLQLDEALDRIEAIRPAARHLVELHAFSEYSIADAAEMLGMSEAKAKHHLDFVRVWLQRHFESGR